MATPSSSMLDTQITVLLYSRKAEERCFSQCSLQLRKKIKLSTLIWSLEWEKGEREREEEGEGRASQLPDSSTAIPWPLTAYLTTLVPGKEEREEGWESSGHSANSFPAQRQSLEDTGLPPVTWSHSPGGRVSSEGSWWAVQSVRWGILWTGHVSQEPGEKGR